MTVFINLQVNYSFLALNFVALEIKGFSREKSLEETKNIYNTTLEILNKAEADEITTNQAAISIAEQRLESYDKRQNLSS